MQRKVIRNLGTLVLGSALLGGCPQEEQITEIPQTAVLTASTPSSCYTIESPEVQELKNKMNAAYARAGQLPIILQTGNTPPNMNGIYSTYSSYTEPNNGSFTGGPLILFGQNQSELDGSLHSPSEGDEWLCASITGTGKEFTIVYTTDVVWGDSGCTERRLGILAGTYNSDSNISVQFATQRISIDPRCGGGDLRDVGIGTLTRK